METEGDPPVSTGPPPEPPPVNRPTDGSIAVTGAAGNDQDPPVSREAGASSETPPQIVTAASASAPTATGSPTAPGTAPSALTLHGAPDASPEYVLHSADVFQDTEVESTNPNPPVSRRYQEDGDAEMGGNSDRPVQKPFRSDLQTQARVAARAEQDDWQTVSRQRRPTRDGRRVQPTRRQTRSKTPAPNGERQQPPPKQMDRNPAPPSVWSTQGAAQLRAHLSGTGTLPLPRAAGAQKRDVDPALAVYYDCATRAANLRFDGDQRPMTKLEQVTLFKWMHREIHLDEPPRFLTETHTSAEQEVFADYDRNHMGYRLYGILPAGIKFSEGNPKYNFCNTALLANRDGPTRTALESMFLEAQIITSEPKSKIVVLRYTRPEQRDQWCGLTFKLGAGTVTMQATDSLTTDLPRVGMDDSARALLYQVHARGHSSLSHAVVRAVFAAAAKMNVFDVKSVESPGIVEFSPHKWVIAFAQITCPAALARVRRLDVTHGDQRLIFDIQHPRANRRAPCTKCLSIRHGTSTCTNKQVQQSLQRHTLQLEVEPIVPLPKLTAALSMPALKQQLRQLRTLAAPELATRLRQEKKEQKAEAKQRVAQAAAHVAREAAREARLVAAAKRHEEEDRARHQLRQAQKAQREVTQQIAALQRLARAGTADGLVHSGAHQGPDTDGTQGGDEAMTLIGAAGKETAQSTSDGQGAECGGDAPQGSSVLTTERGQPDIHHSAAVSNIDASMPDAVVATGGEAGAAEGSTPVGRPTASEESDKNGDVLTNETEANPTGQCSDTSGSDGTATQAESGKVASARLEDANQARQAEPGSNADGREQETDAGAGEEESALSATPAGPSVTGKRTTPPSPSSSDDESYQQAKWSQGPLISPFTADLSPIAGADGAPMLLDEAAGRSSTARTGRRQLPPPPEDEGAILLLAVQRPKHRQKAMSEFYAPETLAEAQERLERESGRGVEAFGGRVIQVPGNGGCLYYALYCCRTGWKLQGEAITVASTHSVEANYYKAGVCKEYQAYLDQMLSDGTVTISDLTKRYFNAKRGSFDKKVRRKTIAAIRQFIDGIAGANLGGKGLERSQWAGDAELFATVWYIREPLFVISVDANGLTSVRIIWLERTQSDGSERIVQFFPEAGEAYEIIRTFLRHRVLPTVIVHTTLARGAGHYDAFRFPEDYYTAWTKGDSTGAAMRARMDPALASLGWYVAPTTAHGIPKTVVVTVDSSGSIYEPSHPSQLSLPDLQLSPDAPLSPPAHFGLLSALNPRGRRRGRLAQLWAQAERLNLQAYRVWDDAQQCEDIRSEPDTVEAGCIFWSTQIPQLVELLRALPYPEVALSLLQPELVIRLGNELNDLDSDGSVPDFVRAEDPVEARRQWVRLVALTVVVSADDLSDLRSVRWLRTHPAETTAALHDIRLYNWTVVSTLVNTISSIPSTLPICSEAGVPKSADRL